MSARRDFVEDALRGLYSMTDLCRRYGISRRIGYNRKILAYLARRHWRTH